MMAPTEADVLRIAARADDVVRNLAITQAYHELSLAVRARTGSGANWCTFATWASKQAGQTIRKEDLAGALRDRLGGSRPEVGLTAVIAALRGLSAVREAASLVDAVLRALDAEAALDRAARAVAIGNRMVFEEIALQFARFLETFDAEGRVRDGAFAEFLDALRPGDPPQGQALLRAAFGAYRAALDLESAKARAERMLYANLLIGLHEQTRLQPQIALALDAAFDPLAVRRRLLAELVPAPWLRIRYHAGAMFGRRPPLDDAIEALLAAGQRDLRHVITATAMTLHLPEGRIVRLGADLDGAYPPRLVTVVNPELEALLARIDPTPGTAAGSGARDWAELQDRLHLIAELFRCYHDWEPLFGPPFGPDQVEAIQAGRRAAGPL